MTRPDYIARLIALDPSETGSGFDEPAARNRAKEHCARMAQAFEAHNAPQMRRDWGRDLLDALRPVLLLLIAVFLVLIGLKAFAGAVVDAATVSFGGGAF